jgi:hypothetical protein
MSGGFSSSGGTAATSASGCCIGFRARGARLTVAAAIAAACGAGGVADIIA